MDFPHLYHENAYSTTSIIRTSMNRTFRLSEHGQKSLTSTTMYNLTSFIRTVAYPNCFVRIIEVALYTVYIGYSDNAGGIYS